MVVAYGIFAEGIQPSKGMSRRPRARFIPLKYGHGNIFGTRQMIGYGCPNNPCAYHDNL